MIQNRSFEFDPIDHTIYHLLYGWETKEGLPLKSDKKLRDGRLSLRFKESSNLSIDMIFLFPAETFKNRVNGCRKDIAQKLADLTTIY